MKHKKLKTTAIALAILLLLCCGAVGIYAADYYRMDFPATEAMLSTDDIDITQYHVNVNRVEFSPKQPKAGLIFYPGGKVEYTAYAPLMHALAEQGILCVIPKMPLNLAVLDMDAAENILELYPEIDTWYIGGHSLGGSMAASYAAKSNEFTGLILLASYSTADLTETDLKVISIYGTEDGVLNMEKYEECRSNLPADTTEWEIVGGNHAQFGSYGPQDGDGTALISAETQLEETVSCIMKGINPQNILLSAASEDANGETFFSNIILNPDAMEFTIQQPLYSSSFIVGSYSIENGILTAVTFDQLKTYQFQITENNELMFLQDASSELMAYTNAIPAKSLTVPDQTIFSSTSILVPQA